MAGNLGNTILDAVTGRGSNDAVGVLVYPPRLNESNQVNTIHFYINGIEDVGFEAGNTGSQRMATKGAAIAKRTMGGARELTDDVHDSLSSLSGSSLGAATNKFFGAVGDSFSGLGSAATGAAHAIGDDVTSFMENAGSAANLKNKVTRLKTHIVLPMPEHGVSAKYGISYDSTDMGLLGALGNAVASGQSVSDFAKNSTSALTRAALGGVTEFVGDRHIGGVKAVGDPNGFLNATTRQTLNPRKEQLFTGVDYRQFSYEFTMTPATPEECVTVRNIIYTFKKHAHPSLELNGFYYKYPSEFQIEYNFEGSKNPWLNNISPCALTHIHVSYGHGGWSTLVNGSPTVISLRLHFLELQPLTRQLVEQNKY
jgi:hypothetical protein